MAARSLQLQLDEGLSVFGEVSSTGSPHGCVLLLHDRDGDLDAVRPFATPLQTLGLTTVLLDLPGHGLSDGDWDRDGARAVRAALDECRRQHDCVGVVALGEGCSLLYELDPAPVRVAAFVAPVLSEEDLAGAASWRGTPLITMGDPCEPATSESMERIARWIRAWSLRLHVHYLELPGGGPGRWTAHMTNAAAAFVAEQLAYAANPAPARPAPSPERQGSQARG